MTTDICIIVASDTFGVYVNNHLMAYEDLSTVRLSAFIDAYEILPNVTTRVASRASNLKYYPKVFSEELVVGYSTK